MFKRIKDAFGKVAEDVGRESREWKIQCTTCGRQKSLASAGGVRYGASGTTYTLGTCSRCGGFRMMRIYRAQKPVA